jgi:2-iminobutanoate/2-iminopropanoate deaminase
MAQNSPIREIVHPKPGGAAHGPGMVPGVRAAGLIFFSAIRGNAPGVPMSDDTAEQAQQAFVNLKLLLEGAGATLDHVAHVTLYLQDVDYRNAFHKVWMEHFPKDPPARIAIQVADANPVPGGKAHFALDVIAVAP